VLEAVRAIPPESGNQQAAQSELLFEKFDIEKLQGAVSIFFFFSEFMESLKTLFMETAMHTTLNVNEQCTFRIIYTGVQNMIQRLRPSSQPLPTIESILEIMITFADPKAKTMLNSSALCVANDMQ